MLRVLLLVAGVAAISGAVYAAGLWLVPVVDGIDKAILAWVNPDEYVPVLDEFLRALTDYSNLVIAAPLIAWMVAFGLYRLVVGDRHVSPARRGVACASPRGVGLRTGTSRPPSPRLRRTGSMTRSLVPVPGAKRVFTVLLAMSGIVIAVFAALGKIWPNSTLVGANILEVVALVAAFAAATCAFHRMTPEQMRRFARLFWLILLSVYLTTFRATEPIKEAVARPRPFNDAHKPWNEGVRPIPDEFLRGANSFPSGHASGTFSLLTPLFWYVRNRKGRTAILGWAGLQGFARVYTAAHFPFCVIMGGLLGFTIGTLVFFTLGGPALRDPHQSRGLSDPVGRPDQFRHETGDS